MFRGDRLLCAQRVAAVHLGPVFPYYPLIKLRISCAEVALMFPIHDETSPCNDNFSDQ